jgi:putative SbcD/Mre11-related phosphoesterase
MNLLESGGGVQGRAAPSTANIYGDGPESQAMRVTFRDRAALLGETLVLADLHVGKAADSNVDFPLGERDDLVDRLSALVATTEPQRVVLAGDVLHSFDRVPGSARATLDALVGTVEDAGAEPVLLRGNHDTMLETLWDGEIHTEYDPGRLPGEDTDRRVIVTHGHVAPETTADLYVVGHDHPAITIEGQKWHCYLYGPGVYEGADVLVLPAFTKLAGGVSINQRRGTATLESPLVTDLDRFRPIVRDENADETREFPPLGEFRELL